MNLFLLSCSVILILFLSCQTNSLPIPDEYKKALEYLETFGYLTKEEKYELIANTKSEKLSKRKLFIRALKDLQRNGNIIETGELDKATQNLMKMIRCGVPDKIIHRTRQKRYDLMSTKWHKPHITWSFNHKNGSFTSETPKIRRILHEAFQIWQEHSTLTFQELSANDEDVDIKLSFEKKEHPDIDPFHFSDITLAHAFQPGEGLGGDGHYKESIDWDFDVLFNEPPPEGKMSFFAVALHEIGHSLGLAHSRISDSVMYEYYSMSTATLAEDDIRAIQHIYGVPKNKKYKPPTNQHEETESPPIWDTRPMIPDKCNTSYDAIALIRNELFIFRGKYMFRPQSDNTNAIETKSFWKGLPEDFTHVDAVYENYEGKIYFFIGRKIFIFSSTTLVAETTLSELGINTNVEKIDAIFKWSHNKRTYIFSGNDYWRFDEKSDHVEKNFPRAIDRAFKDVYDIDTAFSFENELYFFKNEHFYNFDEISMTMKRMKPQLSANKFMNCNIPVNTIVNRFGVDVDFIDLGEEFNKIIDDVDNAERNVEVLTPPPGKDVASSINSINLLYVAIISVLPRFLN
ncbi:hypothetical protein PVAND_001807 [Polypedilum vanderplanki]|uniref:Peptidase metallopeptidase domain-containing protein n=1 Tax=Polypedilum vanderplanki TaxID=319348 RepID=A0A9J6BQE2_POLVA|nr:hypothetical protein PVAND_001807 [Polypedilum vanderplanki]